MVSNANCQPQYNLRAQPDKSLVTIEYIAVVNQTSGEGWDSVSLSLSTAQPAMVATPAVLEPLMVGLAQGLLVKEAPSVQGLRDFIQRRQEVGIKGKAAHDELNVLASECQMFEVAALGHTVRRPTGRLRRSQGRRTSQAS